ncbi:MAG: diversity-generating retroelement protein Avd [Gammaproteobacteria bacterium]
METVKDERAPVDQLAIVEKYEKFINYMYPVAQNIPRKHGRVRDMFLQAMLEQVHLFIVGGKSNQVSRLYAADAGLAHLRFWLRFMSHSQRRIITPKQHRVASTHLAETGKMLGTWIGKRRKG